MSAPAVVNVRVADVGDLPQLAGLFDAYRVFYGRPSDPAGAEQFLRERLERGESHVLMAIGAEGEVLGFVQLYPSFSSVGMARIEVLNDLFVMSSARGRGVARALLRDAEEMARSRVALRLSLSTAVDNRPAQSLYASAGWVRDEKFLTFAKTL